MYAYHRERCASGKQYPQEHRTSLVESGEGVRQRQEPQILRLECLYRGCKNQTASKLPTSEYNPPSK